LLGAYGNWGRQFPQIGILQPGLASVEARIAAGDRQLLDAAFAADWARFAAAVLQAKGDQAVPAPSAPTT
jgi:hypothetical protein